MAEHYEDIAYGNYSNLEEKIMEAKSTIYQASCLRPKVREAKELLDKLGIDYSMLDRGI